MSMTHIWAPENEDDEPPYIDGWHQPFEQLSQVTSAPSTHHNPAFLCAYKDAFINPSTSSDVGLIAPEDGLLDHYQATEGFTTQRASSSLADFEMPQSYASQQQKFGHPAQPSGGAEAHRQMMMYQPTGQLPEHIDPQVLTPQSSNISTPSNAHYISHNAEDPTQLVALNDTTGPAAMGISGRPSLTVDPRLTPAQSGTSSNASPSEPIQQLPSPIVFVSSYDQPDSSTLNAPDCHHRPANKRSRSATQFGFDEGDDADDEAGSTHEQAHTGSTQQDERSGYPGLDPNARGDTYVPSPNQLQESRLVAEKNADVEDWLEKSEAGSDVDPQEATPLRKIVSKRRRAVSAGNKALGPGITQRRAIPGPGLLVDEESGEDLTSDALETSEPESPPAQLDVQFFSGGDSGYFPPTINLPPGDYAEEGDPSAHQFLGPHKWRDPFTGGVIESERNVLGTANAAMYDYELQSAKFDTASRRATWGTRRRRLSDSDIQSILSDSSSLRRLSKTPIASPSGRSRKGSFFGQALEQARGIIRRPSIGKSKSPPPPPFRPTSPAIDKKRDSASGIKPLERISSFGRAAKSPHPDTTSMLMAMTSQMAAIGGSSNVGVPNPRPNSTKRQRSKSEVPSGKTGTPGLAELMTNFGGPPIPTLASPMHERSRSQTIVPQKRHSDDEAEEADEDEEDDSIQSKGIKMDLHIQAANIVPDLEGFKTHARDLNPRGFDFLLQRVANEQAKRYKNLMNYKVKHTHAVHRSQKCMSGDRCSELGFGPRILEPRKSNKDPAMTTQFAVKSENCSDDDIAFDNAEGAVNPAQFPEGIPLPPVKCLPAEFECNLCFKVKKFQKPSDWTKHVHEDVQPFTCTFPQCPDPQSFKRKADWVRHENEKHRQLEWWSCTIPECNHTCFRRDNFVQHLIREHKKPEPTLKPRSTLNKATLEKAREVDEVWRLVEECHHQTEKKSREEPCRFCGNICSSWKRLTVHLAKHMEQISLPVLRLVEQANVSPHPVINPGFTKAMPDRSTITAGPSVLPGQLVPLETSNPMVGSSLYPSLQTVHRAPAFSVNEHYGTPRHLPATGSAMGPFSEGTDHNSSYALGNYASPTSAPINNPSASTYPPPYNAVPRHVQRHSPPQSQHGHLGYPANLNTMYIPQVSEPQMFSSPVEGMIGFQGSPVGTPSDMGMNTEMNNMSLSMNMQGHASDTGQMSMRGQGHLDMMTFHHQQQQHGSTFSSQGNSGYGF